MNSRAGESTDSVYERMGWPQEGAQGEDCLMENKAKMCVWAIGWVSGLFFKTVYFSKRRKESM